MDRRARVLARFIAVVACALTVVGAQDRRIVRPATAGRRLALVIGNNAYAGTPLKNAVADARAMARLLQGDLGFSVTLALEAPFDDFQNRVDQFVETVQPGDTALFFYSGHGIEVRGENYLLPIDYSPPNQEVQVRRRAIAAGELLDRLGERGARVRLLILDACRDNPFSATRSGASGLKSMEAEGAFIAFATAPGRTASDNPGGSNGLFTAMLLDELGTPGMTLPEVFRRVRQRVNEASGGRQLPWASDGIVGDLILRTGAAESAARPVETTATPAAREDALWSAIKDSRSIEPFEDYLQRVTRGELPGLYAAIARTRVAELGKPTGAETPLAQLQRLFGEGVAASRANQQQLAIDKFDAALRLSPKCFDCLFNIGVAQLTMKNESGAETSWKKALELKPDYEEAINALATLYNNQKRFNEASAMITRAAADSGSASADTVFNQGIILWNQGRVREARVKFDQVLRLNANHPEARFQLGMALLNEGQLPQALANFEAYLVIAPNGPYASQAKAMIAQLKR